jgi:hypothetical protein
MVGRDVTGASGVRTVLWAIATIVSPIVCVASGLVWAYAAVVAAAALDGQPTEYYDAGNRFARANFVHKFAQCLARFERFIQIIHSFLVSEKSSVTFSCQLLNPLTSFLL